ncbi:MAG: metal-sensitive transcriptional regulator [Bacteriovorax sp.]|nr:metal-sensitive transcriptional regulator [Bacteriovorax sp.]
MTIKKKSPVKSVEPSHCHHEHHHPDHKKEVLKLKRAKGQIEGILGMIDKRLYCPDILIQVRAAKAALSSVEKSILKTHLDNCIKDAIKQKDENIAKEKIEELIMLIGRHQ